MYKRQAEGGSEKALELALTKFNETIDAAFAELAPHKICQYIYELSDMFNQFYRDNIILGETDKEKQEMCVRDRARTTRSSVSRRS